MDLVDLSKATKKDVVHFRCGGSAEISRCSPRGDGDYEIDFKDYPFCLNIFGRIGEHRGRGTHPFDIVKVERNGRDILQVAHIQV